MGSDRSDEIRWRVAAAERDELRAIGDLMQSEGSRLAEWAKDHALPYEARMAMFALTSAVAKWTEARTTNWPGVVENQIDSEAAGV